VSDHSTMSAQELARLLPHRAPGEPDPTTERNWKATEHSRHVENERRIISIG
jgi:hypothetical protein